jgi:NADPH:quinone reductase-like Zn-dependent oxidoreductase
MMSLLVPSLSPGDPGAPGSDFAGVILEGEGAGNSVLGLSTGVLASEVVASANTVAMLPLHLSFEAGATTPTIFVTAHAALAQAACLQSEDVLLLHGAAGGVGLAVLQVAHAAGARVIATAGSPSKRTLLRSRGVQAVLGSRDAGFASAVACLGGADVVVNSLTSPGMVAGSLAALRRGGRMVEIGKRDVWSAAAAAAERPDVSYGLVAVDFLPAAVLRQLLGQVSVQLARGHIHPIDATVHNMTAARAALRQMAQARHVGKIVVSAQSAVAGRLDPTGCAGCNGTLLVTGGTGALGQLIAAWAARSQCQHIVLCSRSRNLPVSSTGTAGSTGMHWLASGQTLALQDPTHPMFGSMVSTTACDISASEDVASLMGDLRYSGQHMPDYSCPLTMHKPVIRIMHASGVLTDAALGSQSATALRQAMAPKGIALARLAPSLPLLPMAGSVLFSSVAALLGNAGQASYAAANAGLDAASAQLQAAGLTLTSIQFSAWAGAGMAAATAGKVDAMGIGSLSTSVGLATLQAVLAGTTHVLGMTMPLRQAPAVVVAAPFHWGKLLASRNSAQLPPLLAEYISNAKPHEQTAPQPTSGTRPPGSRLAALPGPARRAALLETVSRVVGGLLGTGAWQ